MLSNTASTSKTLSTVSIEKKTESARFLPDSSTGGLFQNCKIWTVNVQVYSGRAEQPSRIRVIIGFNLVSYWLRNMSESCELINDLWKAKLMQTGIFNAHLQTTD